MGNAFGVRGQRNFRFIQEWGLGGWGKKVEEWQKEERRGLVETEVKRQMVEGERMCGGPDVKRG